DDLVGGPPHDGAAPVATDEHRPDRRAARPAAPPPAAVLRTELAHPPHVADDVVEAVGRGVDAQRHLVDIGGGAVLLPAASSHGRTVPADGTPATVRGRSRPIHLRFTAAEARRHLASVGSRTCPGHPRGPFTP